MNQKFNPTTFLSLYKYWMNVVILICVIIQFLIFSEDSNLFAVGIILLSWNLVNTFVLTTYNFINYTFSTFLILGFGITQFAMPLIFTLLEAKPVTYNLKIPVEVFTHSIFALIIVIIAHLFYKNWMKNTGEIFQIKIQRFLYKNHFFDAPSNKQIWIIGFIGIFAMTIGLLYNSNSTSELNEKDSLGKFIEGFKIFSYAPLFIPFSKLLKKTNFKSDNYNKYLQLIYLIILIIYGVLSNSRGLFMQGITSVGLVFFLGLLTGKFDYRIIKLKNFFILTISFWLITGPLSDIGTAMVIVRAQRNSTSPTELLNKTLVVYKDKEGIRNFKKLALSENKGDWDETYFDNIFLARFCNLKFNDANLKLGLKTNDNDKRMLNFSLDRFWAIIPSPILNILPINIDKKKITAASFGDYLYYCNGGENALGGFRTGHYAGSGMAAFGWWYLAVLGIGMIPLFFLIDLYFFNFKSNNTYNVLFSLAGLILSSTIFTFWGTSTASESVINIFTFIFRGWIQSVILYLFVFKISSFLSRL